MTQFCCILSDEGKSYEEKAEPPSTTAHTEETEMIKSVQVTEMKQNAPSTSKKKLEIPLRRSKRVHGKPLVVQQTPMGLPKPIRLPKKVFTVKEIYLNKDYHTPTRNCLETIFEFPKEHKDGTVMNYAKQRKKRQCDFTDNHKKGNRSKKRKVIKKKRLKMNGDVDEILKQKLASLDNALTLANLSP